MSRSGGFGHLGSVMDFLPGKTCNTSYLDAEVVVRQNFCVRAVFSANSRASTLFHSIYHASPAYEKKGNSDPVSKSRSRHIDGRQQTAP
jgi:hypothetical protein